jgi:hypothetical protein
MSFENEQEWFDLFNSDRRAMVLGDILFPHANVP